MSKGEKHDGGKPRMDLVPLEALEEVARVLDFGARKYAPDNWRHVRPFRSRYLAAALRHLAAYQGGQELDPETELPHLAHATCCLLFLLAGPGPDADDEALPELWRRYREPEPPTVQLARKAARRAAE